MPSHSSGGDPDAPLSSPPTNTTALPASAQPAQALSASPTVAGMPLQAVVSNTTPLITLGEIGLLDTLRQLYGMVWIPPSVMDEYQRGRVAHPERPDLQIVPWVGVQTAPNEPLVPASLDAGERDAIALALAHQAVRILLDERAARAVAVRLNLTVTGSAGVLLAAKQSGIIPLVKPHLDRIIAQGRYLSPSLYEQLVRHAGEE